MVHEGQGNGWPLSFCQTCRGKTGLLIFGSLCCSMIIVVEQKEGKEGHKGDER